MPSLTPDELDRLVRSQRRLKLNAVIAVVVLVAAVVAMVSAGFPFQLGIGVGAGAGVLLTVPHQRLLSDLGLSRSEAAAIVAAERKRRRLERKTPT
jgi:hypothetical protein